MKKHKKENEEPKNRYHIEHGLWSNVKYIWKNMIHYEKSLPWLILLVSAGTMATRYLWNFMAKFVLDMVSNKAPAEDLFRLMGIVLVIQCVTTMSTSFANNQIWWRYIGVRTLMMVAKKRLLAEEAAAKKQTHL